VESGPQFFSKEKLWVFRSRTYDRPDALPAAQPTVTSDEE